MSESLTIKTVLQEAIGVAALCLDCGHNAELNIDRINLPSHITLIQAAERLKCSRCGSKEIILGAVKEKHEGHSEADSEIIEATEPDQAD